MEQIQKATLVLKTCTLEPYAQTAKGTVNGTNTSITWNNINFRLLLGDMYDKFDNFNLQLVNITSDDNRTGELLSGNTVSDRIVSVNLSGLNFLNQTYDSNTNNMGSKVVIATYALYKDFSQNYSNNIVTFAKGNEMCNLTIHYTRILDDQPPDCLASLDFPQMVFMFNIYGIPKELKK